MHQIPLKTHFVYSDGRAIVSSGRNVFEYNPYSRQCTLLFKVTFSRFWQNYLYFKSLRSLFRAEIYHVLPVHNDRYLLFFDYRILLFENGVCIKETHLIMRRPLKIYYNPEKNMIAWGEYDTSDTPHKTHIHYSRDGGLNWEKGFCFEEGTIRHVHNIVYDKYRETYWILTGDYEKKAGIWESKDLNHATPVLTGKQEYRAVEIIAQEHSLLIPMDSEKEKNRLNCYEFKSGVLHKILDLKGSVFHFNTLGGLYFISTVVEPSEVNTDPYAYLSVSADAHSWYKIFKIKRQWKSLRFFGYTQVEFPKYENYDEPTYIYFSVLNGSGGSFTRVFRFAEIKKMLIK